MRNFEFFQAVNEYLSVGGFGPDVQRRERREVRRVSVNFKVINGRLFYTGPSQQYMRLVIMTEEEKRSALMECHDNLVTGKHNGVRSTRDRVIARYYWSTLIQDVKDWVKDCHRCQLNDPIKTVPSFLHTIKVKEAWDVLGLDLIGPLPETARHNKFVLTMTDLYTKWVIAETLQSKTISEVSLAITTKLYMFGMVRHIITDQDKEFIKELNDSIFSRLKIKNAVSGVYHPQPNGQDELTNQDIKRTLRKYVNGNRNDWDLHLPAMVYGVNTAKQVGKENSTRHSPYFLLFHRHPRLPEVTNPCSKVENLEVSNPEDDTDSKVNEKPLNETVLSNIEGVQSEQQNTFEDQKCKYVEFRLVMMYFFYKSPENDKQAEELQPRAYSAAIISEDGGTIISEVLPGEVTEPAMLQISTEDLQNALREVLEGDCAEGKDPFIFLFHCGEDMQTFLTKYQE